MLLLLFRMLKTVHVRAVPTFSSVATFQSHVSIPIPTLWLYIWKWINCTYFKHSFLFYTTLHWTVCYSIFALSTYRREGIDSIIWLITFLYKQVYQYICYIQFLIALCAIYFHRPKSPAPKL